MRSIALGLLALFAVAVSSGAAFADCAGHVVKSTTSTTVASDEGSTPVVVPSSRDGG
jgi:hypothetical protein